MSSLTESLCCAAEWHNTVDQLRFKKSTIINNKMTAVFFQHLTA